MTSGNIVYPEQVEYVDNLLNETDGLMFEMESFAKLKSIPILDMQSARFLELIVTIKQPKNVLEIGTAIAYTAIRIARNLPEGGKVTTLEMSKGNIEYAKSFILKASLESKIEILEGDALKLMPKLDKKFDLIFIDADKEDYLQYLELAVNLIAPGGIIVADNLLWHGNTASKNIAPSYEKTTGIIREFNKKFASLPGFKTTLLTIGDGLGVAHHISDF